MDHKIKQIPVADLVPYARNAKRHDDAQVAKLAGSIKEFGFTNPVLTDGENGILAGHGRVMAAQKLGLEKVPCIELGHLTPTQRKAYILTDNRLGEIGGGWNMDLLRLELEELGDMDVDLDALGFGEDFDLGIDGDEPEASDVDAEPQIDKAEELIEKWGVEVGQLWQLGDHRILCGDSTRADDVERVLAGDKPLLMVTDPPYGVEYDPTWRDGVGAFVEKTKMRGVVSNDEIVDWTAAYSLFTGAVAYVWHAGKFCGQVADNLAACDFDIRSQIIWKKHHFAMSRGDYHWHHEPCWYAVRKGMSSGWGGDRTQSTIWEITSLNPSGRGKAEAADEKTVHGTQKPVECMARPIRNHDSEFIYEPFSGSGTTIIACEQLGRKCRAIEISPAYVAVAIQRWADATGKEPRKL